MLRLVITDKDGQVLFADTLTAKEFSSGSQGYHAGGKVSIAGEGRHQLGVNLTRIKSKPGEENHVEGWPA